MPDRFKGTGVAIITPFHDSGHVDFGAFEKIIEHVISNGVNYIVGLGTTGESATLSKDERVAIQHFIVDIVSGRVPVVIGIGGNNTQEIINTIKAGSFEGIDAILSVCPYYNKPQQRGLYNHYKAIAGASPAPVILYNVPGRTSVNLSAETTLKLAHDFRNIIGIKEASGNLMQIMELIKGKPEDFLVISGDDALTLPLISLGADGVISVVANAFPKEMTEMVALAIKGKTMKARNLHYDLLEFTNLLFADGNPSGIKAAMEILGLCEGFVRLPLVKVSKAVQSSMADAIASYQKRQSVIL